MPSLVNHTIDYAYEKMNGKNIHFDKTNLSIKEPHKIITLDKLFNLVLKMQYNLLEISKDTDSEIEFTKLYKYF